MQRVGVGIGKVCHQHNKIGRVGDIQTDGHCHLKTPTARGWWSEKVLKYGKITS